MNNKLANLTNQLDFANGALEMAVNTDKILIDIADQLIDIESKQDAKKLTYMVLELQERLESALQMIGYVDTILSSIEEELEVTEVVHVSPEPVQETGNGDNMNEQTLTVATEDVTSGFSRSFVGILREEEEKLEVLRDKINRKAKRLTGEKDFCTIETSNRRYSEVEGMIGTFNSVVDLTISVKDGILKRDGFLCRGLSVDETLVTPDGVKEKVRMVYVFDDTDSDPVWETVRNHKGNLECSACHTRRRRKYHYVVQNLGTGENLILGSSCAKDYTWGNNLVSSINLIFDLSNFELNNNGMCAENRSYSVEVLAQYSALAVRMSGGYVSRSGEGEPTVEVVLRTLRGEGTLIDMETRLPYELKDEDIDLAAKSIQWIQDMAEGDRNRSQYLINLWQITNFEHCRESQAGLIVSLVPAYVREMKKLEEKKEVYKESGYVGVVGTRVELSGVKLEKVIELEGAYGTTYLHKFDMNGSKLVWFSSREDFTDYLGHDPSVYDKIELSGKASIRSHEEYNGVKQTRLRRVKFKYDQELANSLYVFEPKQEEEYTPYTYW